MKTFYLFVFNGIPLSLSSLTLCLAAPILGIAKCSMNGPQIGTVQAGNYIGARSPTKGHEH